MNYRMVNVNDKSVEFMIRSENSFGLPTEILIEIHSVLSITVFNTT